MRSLAWCAAGGWLLLLCMLLAGRRAEATEILGKNLWRMEGRIKKLDTKKKLLLLTDSVKNDCAFAIGKGTEVFIEGKKAKLEDLKVGDDVAILFHKEARKGEGWRVTERIVKQAVIKGK